MQRRPKPVEGVLAQMRPAGRLTARPGTPLTYIVVAASVMALAAAVGRLIGADPEGIGLYSPHPLAGLTFLVVGCAITARLPHHPVGLLLCATGLVVAAVTVAASFAGIRLMSWANQWLPALAYGLIPLTLVRFPDGQLPGRRWRYVAWTGVAGILVAAGSVAVGAWVAPDLALTHGQALPPAAATALDVTRIGLFLIATATVGSVASLVVRRRNTQGDVRQQINVLALGALAVPIGIAMEMFGVPGSDLVLVAAIPLAIGAAILKYRLFDIDLFLNRTIVYVALTLLLVLVYSVTALAIGSWAGGGPVSPLVATGVVALLFQPLRARLQKGVSRMLYGRLDDPYRAVSSLGRILEPATEPESLFPRLAEAVTEALGLPFAGMEAVDEGGASQTLAAHGRRLVEPEEFPMVHNGRLVGRMLASPRTVGGTFSRPERELLQDLARQAAAAVHGMQLTAALQASRARLVRAREEERARLRRELHDGVGPTLAGAVMQLGAARGASPETDAALERLESLLRGGLAEIRRIVEGLRPASLDALGLREAVARQMAMFDSSIGFGLTVDGDLELPPAVEVAAFRIVSEALTNVVRHSGASNCRIKIDRNGDLLLEVADDGSGLPETWVAGVGLSSMRERAEELGGSFELETGAGGTTIRAHLPLA